MTDTRKGRKDIFMRDVFASGGKYLQMITYSTNNLYPEFMKNDRNLIKRKVKKKIVRSGHDVGTYILPRKVYRDKRADENMLNILHQQGDARRNHTR